MGTVLVCTSQRAVPVLLGAAGLMLAGQVTLRLMVARRITPSPLQRAEEMYVRTFFFLSEVCCIAEENSCSIGSTLSGHPSSVVDLMRLRELHG